MTVLQYIHILRTECANIKKKIPTPKGFKAVVRRECAATSPTALLSILPSQIKTGSVPLLSQNFFELWSTK
jgi:hypothetical protein